MPSPVWTLDTPPSHLFPIFPFLQGTTTSTPIQLNCQRLILAAKQSLENCEKACCRPMYGNEKTVESEIRVLQFKALTNTFMRCCNQPRRTEGGMRIVLVASKITYD